MAVSARTRKWVVALALVLSPSLSQAETKYLVASLGDSITSASLANTSLEKIKEFEGREWLWENKKTYSWASGLKLPSHFYFLQSFISRRRNPGRLYMLNVSNPGSTTYDIPGQVDQVVRAMATGEYAQLKYVTLLIGANDVCSPESASGTPLEKMRVNLETAFAKLASIPTRERIPVMVSSIPKVPDLGKPEIRNHRVVLGVTCGGIHDKVLSYCRKQVLWKSLDEYRQNLKIIDSRNDLLRALAFNAARQYPSLSIHYSNTVFEYELTPDLLAIDCFHPNRKGQEKLSRLLWADQPWFR